MDCIDKEKPARGLRPATFGRTPAGRALCHTLLCPLLYPLLCLALAACTPVGSPKGSCGSTRLGNLGSTE